jgi:hypothetical protein
VTKELGRERRTATMLALETCLTALAHRRDVVGRAYHALARALLGFRPGVVLDEHCYVVDLEDNLLCGVTREDLQAVFGAAAGQVIWCIIIESCS